MKTKKPDIFLGITMGMLVLAAVLCLTILFVQKSNSNKNPTPNNPGTNDTGSQLDSNNPDNTGNENPAGTGETGENPRTTDANPVEIAAIDEAGLKAALDESLKSERNDWQVVVLDPALGTRVDSFRNSPNTDDWMKGDQMVTVFIMGAIFQNMEDGKIDEADVIDDVKAMIVKADAAAGDRLTALLGGGDASKGMEAVKSFAVDNGLKLGYNRTLAGSGAKPNYVSALQMASILNKICKGELVSKDASGKMLDILCTPKDSEPIDVGISGQNVKYGFVSSAKDSASVAAMGIVRLPHRDYVVSVICNDPSDLEAAKAKVTEILKLTGTFFAD